MSQDDELSKFVERYRAALGDGPRALAELYAEPCVSAQAGTVRVHPTRADIEQRAAQIDAGYRTRGFTHADLLTMSLQRLSADSALAIVRWAYKGACEELLWTTTCSYEFYRYEGAWKIVVETVHDA